MRGLILAPGEGLSVENPVGGILTFKLSSDDSGGAVTAIETVAAPHEGPPLHVHDEDELIFTLEGTFRIKLGDELREVPPNSFVFIPRGTPHTWQNVSRTCTLLCGRDAGDGRVRAILHPLRAIVRRTANCRDLRAPRGRDGRLPGRRSAPSAG